jgi:hypothetical protein
MNVMKNPVIILAISAIVAMISCKKSKDTAPIKGDPNLNGLRSIRCHMRVDSNHYISSKYVTWTYEGTNPIIATPNIDTFYLGREQLTFTGPYVTQFDYHTNFKQLTDYHSQITNISYNPTGQIDTLTTVTPYFFILGSYQYAFQYSGNQIEKITVAHPAQYGDTFVWSRPDIYNVSYSGNNISRITCSWYTVSTTRDSNTAYYFSSSRVNNFSGSIPVFLLLHCFEIEGRDLPFYLPIHINHNFADSVKFEGSRINGSIAFTILTDGSGRITHRILKSVPTPDTLFYYY